MITAMYSGGFDPLHRQHVERMNYIKDGSVDALTVIVESDEWVAKKHSVLMPQIDRARIIRCLKPVDNVLLASEKVTTSDLIRAYRPTYYYIGPDHDPMTIPEKAACDESETAILCLPEFDEDEGVLSSTKMLEDVCSNMRGEDKYQNPPVAVSVIVTHDFESWRGILLGKRKPSQTFYDLPGGFLESGETLGQAAVRELKEETGIEIIAGDLKFWRSYVGKYPDDGRDILCVYYHWNCYQYKLEDDETEELAHIGFRDIAANTPKLYSDMDAKAFQDFVKGCQL